MNCKYCGKELEEGALFCGSCGKAVEKEEPVPEEVVPEVNTESAAAVEVMEEKTVSAVSFAEPAFDAEVEEKPKKKKWLKAVIISGIALITAAALVLVAVFTPLKGLILKLVGSDADYFRYVETKAFASGTDNFTKQYANLLADFKTEIGEEANVKLNVGDSVITLLETALNADSGTNVQLDWLKNMDISMNTTSKNGVSKVLAALNINGTSVVDLDVIFDAVGGEIYAGSPALSDKYIKEEIYLSSEQQQLLEVYTDEDFKKALPTDKELNALIDKYTAIVFENIDDVEKSYETVEVGDIEQKLTVLEVEIEKEDAIDIALAVLKTAKNDKELKKYIKDIAKYLEKKELIDDADVVYDEFIDAVKEGIDTLKDEDTDEEGKIIIVDYVNSKHEIVGREIKTDETDGVKYLTLYDKDEFAFELEVSGLEIKGEGTKKKGILNGDYSVVADGKNICNLTIADYNTESDYLNGKFSIAPSKELLNQIGAANNDIASLFISNIKLDINFQCSEKEGKIDLNIVNGSETLIGLTFTAKETEATDIAEPDISDVCEDYEWANTIDLEKLLDRIEAAGIDSQLVTAIEGMITPSYGAGDFYDTDASVEEFYTDDEFYYDY